MLNGLLVTTLLLSLVHQLMKEDLMMKMADQDLETSKALKQSNYAIRAVDCLLHLVFTSAKPLYGKLGQINFHTFYVVDVLNTVRLKKDDENA